MFSFFEQLEVSCRDDAAATAAAAAVCCHMITYIHKHIPYNCSETDSVLSKI